MMGIGYRMVPNNRHPLHGSRWPRHKAVESLSRSPAFEALDEPVLTGLPVLFKLAAGDWDGEPGMANWVFAPVHSLGGIFHSLATCRKTRKMSVFVAWSRWIG